MQSVYVGADASSLNARVSYGSASAIARGRYQRRVFRFRPLLALAAFLLVGGPRSAALTPIYPERITMRSVPVVLVADDPTRTRVGALTLMAGWRIDSSSHQFGGWSGLLVDGDRITALGDAGSVLRFRLGRFGHARDARIDPLPPGCGPVSDKRYRDSESIVRGPDSWWIGFEEHHRICRLSPDLARATGLRRLPEMKRWRRTGGPEAMLRLADGRYLILAEGSPVRRRDRPLLVSSGDPVDPRTVITTLRYNPPDGYAPTDAAQLPDGRVIVIDRRFSSALFTTVIGIIDLTALSEGGMVEARPIARFAPPVISDNFEGIAVTREGDQTIVWLLSDDNWMDWQATYLLKFALDPDAGRDPDAKPPPARAAARPPLRSSASAAAP